MHVQETVQLGGQQVTFETGAVARQASGAVLVHAGETVLIAVCTAATKPTHLPYMPLTTEYRHRLAAVGKVPGSYNRREGQATELNVLTSRIVDRSIRPFFPETWCYDTQMIIHPLSYDHASDVQVLAISAAAAALNVSTIPWRVALGGVRIARCEGELVAFPTPEQRAASDLDLVVSVSRDGIVMLEGGASEVGEDVVLEAFALASTAAAPLHDTMDRLRDAVGREARPVDSPPEEAAELAGQVGLAVEGPLQEALLVAGKHERYAAIDLAIKTSLDELGFDPDAQPENREAGRVLAEDVKKRLIRTGILEGKRLGGRGPEDIREITGRAGWLKRCHGSGLFTRGETQAITTCTLGGERDKQAIETLDGTVRNRFLLHYNFPPFCVGEVRPIRGPARREIGHGYLAKRALVPVLPDQETFPYTIRLESTITESNGSSSMATVCGGTLALLDAGVPMARPVAGIAMGLVKEGDEFVVLSDILGDEDHVGDMDFKVAGTREGITAIQLDNKLGSVPVEVMERALEQARQGRLHILARMESIIAGPRERISPYAWRMSTLRIEPNRIRDLIGRGGQTINGIRRATGVEIDVDDDGTVKVQGQSDEAIAAARERIHDCTGLPELGREYEGRVVTVKHFGAFVRLFEGIEGLVTGDGLVVGGAVKVRVTGVNEKGKLQLQRV